MQLDAVDGTVDVAVVGAGPAGLAAAAAAAELGLSVALLDEQAHPGGQIYRDVTRAGVDRLQVLGDDYAAGRALVERFTQSTARHVGGASVWNISRDRVIHYLKDGRSQSMTAGQVILCTGAMERPFPIPGWTLPGVMTAGAAQILLKSAGVAPSQPVVLAGCGPLLYLLAWQYLRAGVRIGAIVDTTQRGDYLRALRHLGGALAGWRDVRKGLGLIRSIRDAGIPYHRAATDLAVEGSARADGPALSYRSHVAPRADRPRTAAPGRGAEQPDHGVAAPGAPLGRPAAVLGAGGRCLGPPRAGRLPDRRRRAWHRRRVGSGLARAARRPGRGARRRARVRTRTRPPGRAAAVGASSPAAHPAFPRYALPSQDPASRAGRRRDRLPLRGSLGRRTAPMVALGCQGPNQAKAFTRCGMGPCQGRLCGLTVTEVIAHERGVSPAEVGHYRIRPPIKPITLEELAAL